MPQCQFLFSAVFRFRKVTQEIFSELDDSKTEVPIFSVPKELTWREPKWGHRVATRGLGAASPGPMPRVRVGPPWPPPTPPLRPYSLRIGKTLYTRVMFHEKFRRGRHRQTH